MKKAFPKPALAYLIKLTRSMVTAFSHVFVRTIPGVAWYSGDLLDHVLPFHDLAKDRVLAV